SAAEMTEIDDLIAGDPTIARAIEDLRAASQAIRDDFLKTVRDNDIPQEWLQLIKERSAK
ncbi:MAG: hypothetical protein ACR2P3_13205, partial [Geminicoccaceae bacterium]